MSKNNQTALIAKAKAIYGNRIKTEEYHSLIQKNTIPQLIGALKKTNRYKISLASVNETQTHRGQLEVMLNKSVFEIYVKLRNFIPTPTGKLNDFYFYRKELNIVLDAVMFLSLKQPESIILYLPMYMTGYLSFDLEKLASVKDFNDLIKVLEKTKYTKIITPILENPDKFDFGELSIAMYSEYYRWLIKQIESELSDTVKSIMRKEIDRQLNLDNMAMTYRMKKYFNLPAEKINKLIFRVHKGISNVELNSFINSPDGAEKILKFTEEKIYNKKIEINENFFELSAERDMFNRHKSRLRLIESGSVTLYSIMKLLEIEQNNITTIIEGVRYSLPAEEISKLIVI